MIKLASETLRHPARAVLRVKQLLDGDEPLSMGTHCVWFENEFAKKQERKYAVLVNSGSSANLVLIQAMMNLGRLKAGDWVGVSAVTWPTNVMPLIQLGLVPVAIDVEVDTLNVSAGLMNERSLGMKAMFLTNALGFCDDIAKLKSLCENYGIPILEDNCESLGSRFDDTLLGNWGAASTFSFYVGHHLSTIEGGMICTDDDELYEACVKARSHGWAKRGDFTFHDLAYNVRPTEITGVLGLDQIRHWDDVATKRVHNFGRLYDAASTNTQLRQWRFDPRLLPSPFAFPVLSEIHHVAYKGRFREAGVEIRPIIAGDITQQPFWKKYVPEQRPCFNARTIGLYGFYFACRPDLTEPELRLLEGLLEKQV